MVVSIVVCGYFSYDVFLQNTITGVVLNASPKVLLMFNICQCIVGLYVAENGITFFRTVLILLNKIDLSRLSAVWILFRMMFSMYPFPTIRLTKSL